MLAHRPGHLVAALATVALALALASCGSDSSEEPVVSEPTEAATPAKADAVEVEAEPVDTSACPPVDGTDEVAREFAEAPPMCLDPDVDYSALVSTSAGDITIDLDQDAAPVTVNSFVFLARNNYFDETVCHRVVQGFVAQCGDPTATGTGGPGYTIPDEFPEAGAYEVGSIAMAKTQAPNSGGSQFFIISGPNGAALPPLYSLFGEVTGEDDLDVIAEIDSRGSVADGAPMNGEVRILDVEIIEA